ncbi:uncharacterized protein JCM6883_002763 [Sporobolomyces salmoneus]|uniref:uncharacterized protein n=1 Tax=Sporobolomyces salmoneus TaxID=183962 RepID=UPI00317814B0
MEGETISTLSANRQFHHNLGINLTDEPATLPAAEDDHGHQEDVGGAGGGTLMNRLRRTASSIRHHLPFANNSTTSASSNENSALNGAPPSAGPRAWSIAPVTHRENSAKRALYDSMPSLPSIPSLDSLISHPFLASYNSSTSSTSSSSPSKQKKRKPRSSYFGPASKPTRVVPVRSRSNPVSPRESDDSDREHDDEEEDDDDSPPSTPPVLRHRSRSNSLSNETPRPSFDSSRPSSKDPLASLHGNVVMLGGFRGSVLRDPVADQRLWIPLKVPAGIRKVTLALGLTEEDELKSKEKIVGTKMLTHVGPLDMGKTLKHTLTSISHSQKLAARGSRISIPFVPHSIIPHVHSSASSSSQGSNHPPTNNHSIPSDLLLKPRIKVESWGYDFRLKLQTPSRELVERLTQLKAESKARGEGPDGEGLGAVVICHSMGGLVVLHALSQAPDPTIFRGIVFAGTPFQGCVNVLGPLALDQGFRRNPGVGHPNVVFSWRSVFYFLPRGKPYSKGAVEEKPVEDQDRTSQGSGDSSNTATASSQPTEVASPVPSTVSWTSPSTWSSPFTSSSSNSPSAATSMNGATTCDLTTSNELTTTWQSHTKPPLEALFHGCFEDHQGRPIPLNFHDPVTWSKYGLSPLTAGLFGPLVNGEAVDRKSIHLQNKAGGGGGKKGIDIDLSLPLPGAPGTLGEENTISRNGMVGRAVEAGQDAVDHLEGENEESNDQEEQLEEDEVVKKYLERSLEAALEFWDEVDNGYDESKSHLYPPLAVLTNSKVPTVRGVQVKSRETIPTEKYDSLLYAEGDGIVTYDSARTLPGRWGKQLKGVVETSHGHVAMLSDLASVRKAVALLNLG